MSSLREITRARYASLAARYHAAGVPTPPDDSVSVSAAASLAAAGEDKIDGTRSSGIRHASRSS